MPEGGPAGDLYLGSVSVSSQNIEGLLTDRSGKNGEGDSNSLKTGRGSLKKICRGS